MASPRRDMPSVSISPPARPNVPRGPSMLRQSTIPENAEPPPYSSEDPPRSMRPRQSEELLRASTSSQRSSSREPSRSRFSLSHLLHSSNARDQSPDGASRALSRGRRRGLKVLRDAIVSGGPPGAKLDPMANATDTSEDEESASTGSRLFKAGTYTWPIQIPIPAMLPPSIQCPFGKIVYSVRATATRQGALNSNLVSETDVQLISCVAEEQSASCVTSNA